MAIARALDQLLLGARHQTYEEAVSHFDGARKRILSMAATEWEGTETRRRLAEMTLLLACEKSESWEAVERAFAQVKLVGFSDADRHVQDAVHVARWCLDHSSHLDDATAALTDAKLDVARLPHRRKMRQHLEQQVDRFLDAVNAEPRP